METVEDVILRHSRRGMTTLRPFLAESYCTEAAREIQSWERGTVLITTGFFVNGHPETDGPVGTAAVAFALRALGFHVVIVSEEDCCRYFEGWGVDTEVVEVGFGEAEARELLARTAPVGLVSIERCGANAEGDYANMRGISVAAHTAALDWLFRLADGTHEGIAKVPSVAVGDGGNEIGMGNLAAQISEHLELKPCMTCVDKLVIASVSNWGALGIVSALAKLTGFDLLPGPARYRTLLADVIEWGAVDGVTGQADLSEDGFAPEYGAGVLAGLAEWIAAPEAAPAPVVEPAGFPATAPEVAPALV